MFVSFKKGNSMKALISMSILAVFAIAQGVAQAQAPAQTQTQTVNASSKKAVTQTTCKDYLEMDEVIKPKFIYYSVGYSAHGKPVAATFDVVDVDQIKPVLDEFCRVNLTESAYQKVMKESMASEKKRK